MKINKKIKHFFNILFTIVFCLCSTTSYSQKAESGPQIDVSQDQMQKMETMMHEMQNYYESLSPDEKAAFETELTAEVEKEQKRLESMSPEEQKEYVESAFKAFDEIDLDELLQQLEEEEASAKDADNSERAKEATREDNKKVQEQKEQDKKKIKAILDVIGNIIKALENLLEKLSGVKPSPQDLIEKWISKGYIQRWAGSQSTWHTFKNDLDEMIQKLHKLEQVDPKTSKYYYLDNVKEIEKLYGQLDMFYNTIKKYEPNVEVSDEGKIEKETSKAALRRLVSYLVDETKIVTQSIQEVIDKFESKSAPKIKKEEEAKEKKAAKKRKVRGRVREAGTAQGPDYEPDYGFGYSPYGQDSDYYSPATGSYDGDSGDMPDYSAPSYDSYKSPKSTEKPGKKDTVDKDKGEKDEKKEKPTKSLTSGKIDYLDLMKKNQAKLHRNYKRIEKNLDAFEEAYEALKNMENWKNIDNYLYAAKEQDKDLMEKISKSAENLSKAQEKVFSFEEELKKVKDSNTKTNYKKEFNALWDNYKDNFKEINKKINKIDSSKVIPERSKDFKAITEMVILDFKTKK